MAHPHLVPRKSVRRNPPHCRIHQDLVLGPGWVPEKVGIIQKGEIKNITVRKKKKA